MKSLVQFRNLAINLRENGQSFSEITKKLGVSKGILSIWLKGIRLSDEQKLSLKERATIKMQRGRLNALISNKSKRVYKEKYIYEQAEKEFDKLIKEPLFITGISLCMAKGLKQDGSFSFTSSDKNITSLIEKWLTRYLNINMDSIKYSKNGDSLKISVYKVDISRRVIAWQKLLIKYYDSVS